MTGREWQHALYLRDRWNVNPKLTLDLGLRWECLPDHDAGRRPRHGAARPHHARDDPRWPRRQSEERRARAGQGQLRAAPWRDLSSQRRDGLAWRLRHHLQRHGLGAADARRSELSDRRLREVHIAGDVRLLQPARSGDPAHHRSRREQRPRTRSRPPRASRRPSQATSTAASSRPGTRRSSAGCRGTCRSTSPTSARRAAAGTPGWMSTCRTTYGGGAQSRPYFPAPFNRTNAIQSWGQRLETRVQLAARSRSTSRSRRASCSRAPTRSASR